MFDGFESGNERVRERAAEAHGMLGLLYWPMDDDLEPAAAYARAIKEYEKARDMSTRPVRQAVFSSALGYAYGQLKAYDQADREYARAVELDPSIQERLKPERESLRQERAARASPVPTEAGR